MRLDAAETGREGAAPDHGGRLRAVLADPALPRRLRLGAGLVLFAYVGLHLANHALGNISLAAMQSGEHLARALWQSWPGTVALYGAALVHVALALHAIYARRSFRMGFGEWLRLALGFAIVPLLVHHIINLRYAWSVFDVGRGYESILYVYGHLAPALGLQQRAVLLIVWIHGCMGVHYWLRFRAGYRRLSPVLTGLAVLVPVLALLGTFQGERQVLARAAADPGWIEDIVDYAQLRDAGLGAALWAREVQIHWAYALAILMAVAARGLRRLVERRSGLVRITYPSGRVVPVARGLSVLEASRRAGIPHASVCGGRGRCSTCRVRVLRGVDRLPDPSPSESKVLERLRAGAAVRLACQLRPTHDLSILPLLPPGMKPGQTGRLAAPTSQTERFVVIMFVDIRRSTALVERRLPYDVIFLLNYFFDAVGGAVVEAGGTPNQFLGDGMMALFGVEAAPETACRQALHAARLIHDRLDEMNQRLEHDLPEPIAIGIGLHGGSVILGELGYRDRFLTTAIGDPVHVAARLQDLTKEFGCELVMSEEVGTGAGIPLDGFPRHEIAVRGRDAAIAARVVAKVADLGAPVTA